MERENFKAIIISKAQLPKSIQIRFTEISGRTLMSNGMRGVPSEKSVLPKESDGHGGGCLRNTRGIGHRPPPEASRELTGLLGKPWAAVGEGTGTTHGSPGQSTFSPRGLASLGTSAGSASQGAGLSVGIGG